MTAFAKFCLFAVVGIVIGAGALWFVGGKKHAYSTEFTLNATPQQVFVFLSNPKYLKQWVSGLQEMDLIESRDDRGPQYEIVKNVRGRKVTMRQEVIKFVQDSMIAMQIKNDSMVSTTIFRLEDVGEKTKVIYKVKEEGKGFMRILKPFQKSPVEERMREESRMLKRILEKNLDKLDDDDLPVSPLAELAPDMGFEEVSPGN